LTFFDPSVDGSIIDLPLYENPMFTKAVYFVGLIFDQVGDQEEAERFLLQAKIGLDKMNETEKLDKCNQILSRIRRCRD